MNHQLDVIGLKCPMPILRAKKMLSHLDAGDVLTVLATDAGAPDDFAAFCDKTGHQLLESKIENEVFVLVVKKKED